MTKEEVDEEETKTLVLIQWQQLKHENNSSLSLVN